MNTDSGMMNTDSGNCRKSVHVPPESLFTFDQNRCSPSTGITVHLSPEYAVTAITTVCLSLLGCGGGSSDPDSTTPTDSNNTVLTGIFVDSAVEGASYSTATQSGTTNAQGQFNYIAGEQVTFSIGATQLPTVTAAAQVSPVDMGAGNTATTTNIARLLQSLDSDGNPNNGITITTEAAATAATINFNVSVDEFANNTDVINLVANSGSTTTTLISAEAANTHLNETLNISEPQTPQPTNNFSQDMLVGRYIIPDPNIWLTIGRNIFRFDSPNDLTVVGTPGDNLLAGDFPWSINSDGVLIVDFGEFESGLQETYELISTEGDVLSVSRNSAEASSYTLSVPLSTEDLNGRLITTNSNDGQQTIQFNANGSVQLQNLSGEMQAGSYAKHPVDGVTIDFGDGEFSELALVSGSLENGIVLKWDFEPINGFSPIVRLEFFQTNGNTWNSIVNRTR